MRIEDLIDKLDSNRINLAPAYQRKDVWKPKDCELLIDSILRKYPIPEIMLHAHMDEKSGDSRSVLDVIDGKQRITTIRKFYRDEFPIEITDDLLQYHNLEKYIETAHQKKPRKKMLKFSELPEELKRVFLSSKMREFELSDDEFNITNLFQIFVRINKTGQKLKPQEIRSAMFNEYPLMQEARKLADGEVGKFFERHGIISTEEKKRMLDVEFTLEMLVLLGEGIQDKKKTLDKVIKREASAGKTIKDASTRTKRMLKWVGSILPGLVSTRLHKRSDFYSLVSALADLEDEGYNIENEEYHALAGSMLTSLSSSIDSLTDENRNEKTKGLDIEDEDLKNYFIATQHSTDTKSHRTIRSEYIKKLIGSVIGKKDERRLFTPEQKRLLWHSSSDKICKICRKKIDSWDDLEPDHILPWSKQGKTDIENGQLAHASCNSRRGNKPLAV